MNKAVDLEQQARELLASEYEEAGFPNCARWVRDRSPHMHEPTNTICVRAIVAALEVHQGSAIRELIEAVRNWQEQRHGADADDGSHAMRKYDESCDRLDSALARVQGVSA